MLGCGFGWMGWDGLGCDGLGGIKEESIDCPIHPLTY